MPPSPSSTGNPVDDGDENPYIRPTAQPERGGRFMAKPTEYIGFCADPRGESAREDRRVFLIVGTSLIVSSIIAMLVIAKVLHG